MVDFYVQLDKYIKQYEQHEPYQEVSIYFIRDLIDWCWKRRKITRLEMDKLTDRLYKVRKELL